MSSWLTEETLLPPPRSSSLLLAPPHSSYSVSSWLTEETLLAPPRSSYSVGFTLVAGGLWGPPGLWGSLGAPVGLALRPSCLSLC